MAHAQVITVDSGRVDFITHSLRLASKTLLSTFFRPCLQSFVIKRGYKLNFRVISK